MASLFDQAFAPYSMDRKPVNVLNQILGGGFNGGNPTISDMPVMQADPLVNPPQVPAARQPRDRRSVLDIIGGIADTVATVGGSPAMYQPTLDAREDRRRQMEFEDIRNRLTEQQLQAGEYELSNLGRGEIGQALAGLMQSENPAADWAVIAQTAGIPPEKVAAIGAEIERNPGIVPQLATAFGYQPQRQGSPSALESEYALRAATLGKEAADEWLRTEGQPNPTAPKRSTYSVNAGDRIEEYDIGTGRLVRTIPVGAKPSASQAAQKGSPAAKAEAATQAESVLNDLDAALKRLADAGGMNTAGTSGAERAGMITLETLSPLERVLYPTRAAARQDLDGLLTQGIFTLVPVLGATIGSKNFDAAKEVENLKRAVVGAQDYDTAQIAVQRWRDRILRLIESAPASNAAPPSGAPSGNSAAVAAARAELERRRQGR